MEEALYPQRQPEAFAELLRPYLSPGFEIATCRKSVVWIPFAFTYHTFIVKLAERPPLVSQPTKPAPVSRQTLWVVEDLLGKLWMELQRAQRVRAGRRMLWRSFRIT